MKLKIASYEVHGIAEETECEECGWPIYSGDLAYYDNEDPMGPVFCSRACCRKQMSRFYPETRPIGAR